MARKKRGSQQRVSEKIRYLRHEGVPEKQAVGEAYGMERSGRLGRHGVYHRKRGRHRRRGGSR
jgi:hypothetical protein